MQLNEEGTSYINIYNNNEIGSLPQVIGKSNEKRNEENIIKNGNFENQINSEEFYWECQNIEALDNSVLGYNGLSALLINNNSSSYYSLTQSIENVIKYKNKTLNFLGYVRGEGTVEINIKVNDEDHKKTITLENVWEELIITNIEVPENITSIKVIISAIGSVRLSCFKLYINQVSRNYNYIENGKFTNNLHNWVTKDFSSNDVIKEITLLEPLNNIFQNAIYITGNVLSNKEIKQEINVSGGAGEELLLSFFTKANIYGNDTYNAFIEVHYNLMDTKIYRFSVNKNIKEYQKVIWSVITESSYDKVVVGIEYLGIKDIYVSDFSLYKETFGSFYNYNEQNTLMETISGSLNTNIEYYKNQKVKRISTETGEVFEYTYNELGQVESIKDNKGNSFNFLYDENEYLKQQHLITSTNKEIVLSQTNDLNGNVLNKTDVIGNITAYEYDDKERIKIINYPSGEVKHYIYDEKDNIIKNVYDIETNTIEHNFSYNDIFDIQQISVNGCSNYEFNQYDKWHDLENIKINQKQLNKFLYYRNSKLYTGMVEKKEYSDGTNYYFTYDNLLRLTKVEHESNNSRSIVVEYEYDNDNNVISKSDILGKVNYSYDASGQLVKEQLINNETKEIILTEYDNLGHIQEKSIQIDNKILNYNYAYKYEFNEYQSSGYFSRLENSFYEDIIFEDVNLKYGTEPVQNTITIIHENDIKRNIIRFDKTTSTLKYNLSDINSKRIDKTIGNNIFQKEEWDKSFSKHKEILMWIRVNNLTQETNEVKVLSLKKGTEEKVSLSITNSGVVKLRYDNNIIQNMNIKAKEWNLIGITLKESNETQVEVGYFVNEYLYTQTLNNNYISELETLVLGNDGNILSSTLIMPFDILYMGIGAYDHSVDSYRGIYSEGYKYIFSLPINPKSGVIYYNHQAYQDMDVVPLNGSLTSVKGNKPIEYIW